MKRMRMKKFLIGLLVPAIAMTMGSCNDDDDGNEPEKPKSNVVYVTKDIDEPTTWSGDSIYVIKTWDFYVNNTLTIEPGTIVKFHPDGKDLTLGGQGTIIAVGTADKPIIFTSYKDDDHGGDTNGDGSATQPLSKDWGEINTNGHNGSRFEFCHFYYGGNSTWGATLTIEDGIGTVKHCVFAYNAGTASHLTGALNMYNAHAGSVVENCTFYGNQCPLSISEVMNIDNTNVFHNPDNPSETNKYNGIYVYSADGISTAITWAETEVPFVIDDVDFWINENGTLTLGNDVVIKFTTDSRVVLAGSISNGTGPGVYFTSYKDDSKKGDTNADGNSTSPANGDWEGIYDNIHSAWLTWSNILYDSH